MTSAGFGRMAMGERAFGSATPAGIMRLLDHHEIALAGVRAVVLGRSPILGKPMAAMLVNRDATVTVCHSKTRDLPAVVAEAELVVAAVGRPEFVKGAWIRPGAVVIDAGYHPPGVGDVELARGDPEVLGLHARAGRRRPDDDRDADRADGRSGRGAPGSCALDAAARSPLHSRSASPRRRLRSPAGAPARSAPRRAARTGASRTSTAGSATSPRAWRSRSSRAASSRSCARRRACPPARPTRPPASPRRPAPPRRGSATRRCSSDTTA